MRGTARSRGGVRTRRFHSGNDHGTPWYRPDYGRAIASTRGCGDEGRGRTRRRQVGARSGGLDLVAAMFPPAAERDPEGEEDEPDVEPETGAPGVDPIVPELVATSDIPRCVDLSDAGESGSHAAALEVTGDLLERDESAVGRLDLAGTEGTRPD